MEKLINIKELTPFITNLIEKIQLLDSTLATREKKINCVEEINNIVADIHKVFVSSFINVDDNENNKILKEKTERIFSRFEWNANVAVSPDEFQKHSGNIKTFMSSVLKLLGTKGCGILIIEIYLKLCSDIGYQMETMERNNQKIECNNFSALFDSIVATIHILQKYWYLTFVNSQKNLIALCLSQICKILPFLLKMIEVNNSFNAKFSLKLLNQCFNKLSKVVFNDEKKETENCDQEFLNLMNFCIKKFNNLSENFLDLKSYIENAEETIKLVKPIIDEILCYAMSIAHVTKSEIYHSVIMNSCSKVLQDFKDLNESFVQKDINKIKLNALSIGESICNVERQVNTAVLYLVLDVFSGINCPLKNLIEKCKTEMFNNNKTMDDLNNLVSEFDLQMDKIMQIGFFTISCSNNINRNLRILSCLTCLETLETELIPCLTELYIDCNPNSKSNFQYLIDFWLTELTELKILIDSIIDPAIKQIRCQIENLKNEYDSINATTVLYKIVRYSRKLLKTVKTSLKDDSDIPEGTEKLIHCVQLMLERALKRGEYLLQTVSELSLNLFELAYNENMKTQLTALIPQKDYFKLCTNSSDEKISSPTSTEILTPYINEGVLRSKKRNLFYSTPSEKEENLNENRQKNLDKIKLNWNNTPKSMKRSRCCKPLNLNLELENNIDLELTSILQNLTCLRQTLPSNTNKSIETDVNECRQKKKDAICDTDNVTQPILKSSGCCANFNSEENEKNSMDDDNLTENNITQEDENINFSDSRLRNNLLNSLDSLTKNSSLDCPKSNSECELNTFERLNDIKFVEKKIDYINNYEKKNFIP
ncbi:conserved hypothetical protein [Pediculus humanus corporis]|uniref:Serendipity locus protein alpha n=1 Tax=Pediculus humanus subsp. corporis TaxID=121224 RepID=E0V907_PEDHC|nr:uncharacterized protein Phum_PHUM003050 [Pediculus humanus corporis]EEB09863.1 conserved hypothetical protein [Pediculus humanus corporis]